MSRRPLDGRGEHAQRLGVEERHLTDVRDHECPRREERLERLGEHRRRGQIVLTTNRDEPPLAFDALDPNSIIHSERLPGCRGPETPAPNEGRWS